MSRQFVFAYGSLVDDVGGKPASASGLRRVWGVAMDNTQTIPGYKFYVDRETRDRPSLFIAFLDVVEDAAVSVNGMCLAISESSLAETDERERNYVRIEITDRVDGPAGRVWTYVGSADGRARLRAGVERGTAAVSDAYRAKVERGFERLGELDRYRASTDEPPFPVLPLDRIDVPG